MKDDQHGLKWLMYFITSAIDGSYLVGAGHLLSVLVMMDSGHDVHSSMRSLTDCIAEFGTGTIDQKSSMKNMITKSSIETQHVSTSENLLKLIYFEPLMSAQGYQ